MSPKHPMTTTLLLLLLTLVAGVRSIGVNFGTLANNLPSPSAVAQFLKTRTDITCVKIFDANADIIRAFSGTGIKVVVTVGNGDIVALADPRAARRWVDENVKAFVPGTEFSNVLVGSEVLHWGDHSMVSNLVPAMRSIHNALLRENLGHIKTSSGTVVPASSPKPSKQWCVPKVSSTDAALQANINWACSEGGVNCKVIEAGGPCYTPNTVRSHAAYVMNSYYQVKGHKDFNCDFASTGLVTTSNPSYGACEFDAQD